MKKTLRMKFMLLLFALVVGISNAWADTKTGSWDLTTASDDWTSHECVTYFSQPYGMKKVGPYIINSNIEDFSTSGITSIKIGVKSLQNGSTTSILTVYLVDEDGETVGSGLTISPVNASSASSTTYKYVTFNSGFTNVTGFKVQCTTFGKNVLVNGASYEVTYSPAPAYTITAQSNNTTYGTVSLSGSVITGSPNSGYRYASPAYTVSSGTATVSQSGNDFTVTPSSDCTVTINFEAIPTYTATFSVNGATTSQSFLEGAAIEFPSAPANISGKKFVGWVMETIAEPTDEEPSFVNTATETMGSSNVTYYAVFATATASGDPVETKTQTLQYDSWTYSGTTTDKSSYRLFGNNSYIESVAFDLSKLSKVKVWGGTYGGSYSSLTIGDGTNIWKSGNVSTSGGIGTDEFTGETPLIGTNKLRITATAGNGTTTGLRISKVEIYTLETPISYSGYCTSVEVYTITAVSNNTEYGTVTLSGEVITGSPKPGYRYASPAYTVSPANSANVVQDGNEFTVTPLANTTVTINFELIPTYTLSSAVSPENAGTVTLGASSGLVEGATTTATASANAGFKFTGWSISGSGATLSSTTDNPTTVTIGTANATVTANFEEVTTYAITYSVNGVPNTVNVEENTAVDLSAPSSALIPLGYVFKGWRTSAISTSTDTEPTDYVTLATSTEDVTYYAVMAIETITSTTVTLNASGMSTAAYGSGTRDDDKGNTWSYYAAINNDSGTMNFGLNSNANNYNIGSPSFSGNITAITMKVKNGSSKDARTVYICSSNSTAQPSSGDIASLSVPKNSSFDTNRSIDLSSSPSFRQFYVYVSAALSFSEIKVTYDKPSYSGYCSTINTFTNNDGNNWNTNGNWSWGAVPTTEPAVTISAACTIPNGTTANVDNIIITGSGSLTIADGGQLITANPVTATVEKTINKPNVTWGQNDNTGWYAISSPVGNIAPGSVTNMTLDPVSTVPQYDLYKYVENMGWYNSQYSGQSISTLGKGCGYLYARSETATLSFTGSVVSDDVDLTGLSKSEVKHSGLHLIGNPYTHKIYYGVAIDGDISDAGYYKLNSTGSWISTAADTAIDPMEAVFVFVTSDNASVSFTNDASAPEVRANHDFIQFTVANSQYEDVAYAMFDKGNGLSKIEHRNSEAPMIYIPQNDDNYAIAMMNDNTQMFGLNFKAATTGKYTLSYNTKGDYSYLHLIDRLTGEDIDMLIDNEYSFIGSPIDGDNRFIIKLTYNSGNDEINNDIFAYQNGNDIIVSGEGELQVYDVTGRFVMSEHINGIQSINIKSQGVYILRLMGLDVKTQKIVVR